MPTDCQKVSPGSTEPGPKNSARVRVRAGLHGHEVGDATARRRQRQNGAAVRHAPRSRRSLLRRRVGRVLRRARVDARQHENNVSYVRQYRTNDEDNATRLSGRGMFASVHTTAAQRGCLSCVRLPNYSQLKAIGACTRLTAARWRPCSSSLAAPARICEHLCDLKR